MTKVFNQNDIVKRLFRQIMKKILVIDDDKELCTLLDKFLSREGFEIEFEHDSEGGLEKALSGKFQAVVLDVMLPNKSGFDVLRSIRAASPVPVLMLTARGEEIDRIVGLEIGADDYLPKPFSTRELVARLNALFRRVELDAGDGKKAIAQNKIEIGDLEIIPEARLAKIKGEILEISTAEFDALLILTRSVGKAVSRDELAEAALGRELSPFDRSVDMLISRLRRKLGLYPDGSDRIRSIRNSGYLYVRPIENEF